MEPKFLLFPNTAKLADMPTAGEKKLNKRRKGPKKRSGYSQTRLNALRHGLSLSVFADPGMSAEVERMALKYAGPKSDQCRLYFARMAAEADFEISRAHSARMGLVQQAVAASKGGDPGDVEAHAFASILPQLERIQRYENRAYGRRRKALQFL